MDKTTSQDKYLFIVNKSNPLTAEKKAWLKENFNYVPYADEDSKESFMEEETFKAYTALTKLMKKKHHYDVDSHSAGRTDETQKKITEELTKEYGEEWAKTHIAPEGTSEHSTGLAFDLRFKHELVPEHLRANANEFAKRTGLYQKVFKLIAKEAVEFGLVMRYTQDKQPITGYNGELWHFRYVGKENAKAMTESGMCLEEYVASLENAKQTAKPEESQPGNE